MGHKLLHGQAEGKFNPLVITTHYAQLKITAVGFGLLYPLTLQIKHKNEHKMFLEPQNELHLQDTPFSLHLRDPSTLVTKEASKTGLQSDWHRNEGTGTLHIS